MKKLFYVLCPLVLVIGACNVADEADYEAMAGDICTCVNKNTDSISEGMKTAIIDAVKSGKDLETAMSEHMMKDPEQGMKDAGFMMGLEVGMTTCMTELESKYKDVYSTDSEKVIQDKLIKKLEENKECGFTYAIVKLGTQEMEKGN